MFSDNPLVIHLVSLLKQFGISRVVISPGSRHFPITHSIENDTFFKLFSVVDERSAAFFALGLIQRHNEPVAVCCTSGTSSLNYGSAVAEAYYQHLPLLLLTADRLPELLNQQEEQMYKQDDVFRSFISFHGQLKQIHNTLDEWYCNRVINEGLLALTQRGPGPVQLNIPIEAHDKDRFGTAKLPLVRKISRHTADEDDDWTDVIERLSRSKVMVILGQNSGISPRLSEALSAFTSRFNCVILCDRLANFSHPASVSNTYTSLRAVSSAQADSLSPDIVITLFANYIFNGEIKNYLRPLGEKVEHWSIGRRSDVSDPFRRLTQLFEMKEEYFFWRTATVPDAGRRPNSIGNYAEAWRLLSSAVPEPSAPFSELKAIGDFIRRLPSECALHIANSAPIRMALAYSIPASIQVLCNRGINGIDGCMSSAVGFAAEAGSPVFLIIGDLTFFYDMNALWNRHLSSKLKILLLNNEGGAVMHMPFPSDTPFDLARHVSAGHCTSAQGWVESLRIKYFAAHDAETLTSGLERLFAEDGPSVLEVFTKKESDIRAFKTYLNSLRPDHGRASLANRAERAVKRLFSSPL